MEKATETQTGDLRELSVGSVMPNPNQPRKSFSEASIQELASSVLKHGLIQPITVTPRGEMFLIIAGERRWRAHVAAGLKTIMAFVVSRTEAEIDALALVENDQREEVIALEIAEAYARAKEKHGWSVKQLADEIKRPRKKVLARLARARQLFAVKALHEQRLSMSEFEALCGRLRASQKQGTLFDLDAFVSEIVNARQMGKAERTRKEVIESLSAVMVRRGLVDGSTDAHNEESASTALHSAQREEGGIEYRVAIKFRVMHEQFSFEEVGL